MNESKINGNVNGSEGNKMDSLIIQHSAAGGTVLLNTTKGDGAADVLRGAGVGWRWSRNIGLSGAWYVPHSRDQAPTLGLIERCADLLREAGFPVEVQIDAAPRSMDDAEAERAKRIDARVERLSDRAARRLAKSDAHYDAARQILEGIPCGQPILVDHHSAGRARADHKRISRHLDAFSELRAQAHTAQAATDAAEVHMKFRHNPLVIVRRIERLEAERRSVQRYLDGYTRNSLNGCGEIVYSNTLSSASGQHRIQLDAQAAYLDEQIRYWNSVLDQARATGTWTPIDRKKIRPGDLIKYRGKWLTVVRVNQKTISVNTGYSWTDKVPLLEIVDHRRANQTDRANQQAS